MTRNEYNGWANYETWVVKLWMDNELADYDRFTEMAREYLKVDKGEAGGLAEALKEAHEEALPKISGFAADLLGAAMSEVDWFEIAESLLRDVAEELEGQPA